MLGGKQLELETLRFHSHVYLHAFACCTCWTVCKGTTNMDYMDATFNCPESPFGAECTAVCDEGLVPSGAGAPKSTCGHLGAHGWGEPFGACVAGALIVG